MFEAIAARKSCIAEHNQPSRHKKYRRGTTMSNPDLDLLDPSVKLDPKNINRHRSTGFDQHSMSTKPSRHGAAPQSRTGQCHDLIQGYSDATKCKHHRGTGFLHRSTDNAIAAQCRAKTVRKQKLKILISAERDLFDTKV